jgi:hypothetical protein
MADEILKMIDDLNWDTPSNNMDKMAKALRVAVEYIDNIPDWHLLMTMPPKSPKELMLKQIAKILGVKEGEK